MVTLGDVERSIASADPQLGELIERYLAQADPEPGRDELTPAAEGEDDVAPDVPAGAFTLDRLRGAVGKPGLANKTATERKLARREAFEAAVNSPHAPPRLKLGAILIALYERGDDAAIAALLHVFAVGKLRWGAWQAAKTIYKRAEERHDAALFGVLGYRFDAMTRTPYDASEIGAGTLLYLRRRVWRHLRGLGRSLPDAYATFAVEVLRHYPASYNGSSWVAAQIWSHGTLAGARGSASFTPPTYGDPMQHRAYPAAWKASPAPLLRLLDSALNNTVCDFAIRCLRADHPLALRAVEPAWLARLGQRPVAAIHAFVVALLKDSPELHQSKLREVGLHDTVMGFLRSPSPEARAYALEYAAAHGGELAADELVELVEQGAPEVAKFAAARLEGLAPTAIGLARLLRLVGNSATPWVAGKLAQGFSPRDVDAALFVDTAARGVPSFNAIVKFFNDKTVTIPAGHWVALLDDPRFTSGDYALRTIIAGALVELGKRTAREIGIPWIQKSLENRARTDAVQKWLDAGMLAGGDLDVEWLKSLVGKPRLRPIALRVLADRRRVAPARVGLAWLLELARSSETALSQFAQRMLLESFEPADFAPEVGTDDGGSRVRERAANDAQAGVVRLWELATGKKSPEAVRAFAATYLRAHHPELGPQLAEAKALGIKPRLTSDAYRLATIRPLLDDARADVRRFATAIASAEIVRWNDPGLVYELAGAPQREPRTLGVELLLSWIAEGTPAKLPDAWLDGRRLFQLAESAHKASREVALTLIRRLYERVGGAERLGWLMESPERDVRLFAVRLFWDRHRPKPWPADFQPRKPSKAAIGTARFADLDALRQFARVVLFGLPPGRVGERDPVVEGSAKPERALPASIAKQRLIAALRDVALEDLELARAIAPVLGEFVHSTAKGEWQASVQALTALRAKHSELVA